MYKYVTARTDHICLYCETLIKKNEECLFISGRNPKFDNFGKQIGIIYYHGWLHSDYNYCYELIKK